MDRIYRESELERKALRNKTCLNTQNENSECVKLEEMNVFKLDEYFNRVYKNPFIEEVINKEFPQGKKAK